MADIAEPIARSRRFDAGSQPTRGSLDQPKVRRVTGTVALTPGGLSVSGGGWEWKY